MILSTPAPMHGI